MSVIFFDGWDLTEKFQNGGIVPIGLWDWQGNPNWNHGVAIGGSVTYVDGYKKGRGFYWTSNNTSMQASVHATPVLRAAWWGYFKEGTGSLTERAFCFIDQGNDPRLALRFRQAGGSGAICDLAIIEGSTGAFEAGTVIPDTQFEYSSEWAHYEIYVDTASNNIQLVINGVLTLSVDDALDNATSITGFAIHRPATGVQFVFDHIVVTDGDSLVGTEGYHGVAVLYGVGSKNTGSGLRVHGRIRIGDNDYYATSRAPTMRGTLGNSYSPEIVNYYHDYWMTNPQTEAAWGTDLAVDSWGVCRADDTGGIAFFPNMALTFIEMVDGFPEVRYEAPGGALEIDSDTWQRTNDTLSWHGHVLNYPRDDPQGWEEGTETNNPFEDEWPNDEEFIGVTGPSCILFSLALPPHVFAEIGLTFAEEYRINYRDWENVTGPGENFESYFITGYKLHGDANKKFQSNYLTVNYETHTTGSAFIQGLWDYALGGDTGRWGVQQQIYGPTNDTDYKHAFRKLKLRGHGRVLQMKVKSQEEKPFFLNGWSMFVTGNTTV